MARKKNPVLSGKEITELVLFFTRFKHFDTYVLPNGEYGPYDEMFEEGYLNQFDRVSVCTLWVTKKDYDAIVEEFGDKETASSTYYVKPIIISEKEIFLIELFRQKRNQAIISKSEMEFLMNEAIEREEFEVAAKWRDKIKKLK
jgi:hypothetical protein